MARSETSIIPIERSVALLRTIPLFANLPAEELERLSAALRLLSYPSQALLFIEGDAGDRFYIVVSGTVEIIKSLGTGDERLVNIRGPGEFIGEMSLLNPDGRRTASARIAQPTHLLELTSEDFEGLLRINPSLAYEMLRVLSQRLRDAHDRTIHDLHEKNIHLVQAYAELQAAQAQIIAQETLLRELRLAREIQESMLPRSLPRLPDVDLGACMIPARQVGGDFYDLFMLDEDRIGIAIGDVAGKGIPAALLMALVCSLLRAEASRDASPAATLHMLNRHLLARSGRGMFATAIYGVFSRSRRELSYVRAGHELPLAWDAQGAPLAVESGRGQPLGLFAEPFLDVQRLSLPVGATLLLFTDGITEASDSADMLFGDERLRGLALAQPSRPAQTLCNDIVAAVMRHQGEAPQADDLTLLALRVQ